MAGKKRKKNLSKFERKIYIFIYTTTFSNVAKSTANKGKLCHIDIFYLLVRFYSVQRDNLYKINLDIQHYINKENHIYNIKWSHIQVTYKRTLLLSYSLEIMLKLGVLKELQIGCKIWKPFLKSSLATMNHFSDTTYGSQTQSVKHLFQQARFFFFN